MSQEIKNTNLDFYSNKNNDIYNNNFLTLFDNTGNNLIIPNSNLYSLFFIILHEFIQKYITTNIKTISFPKNLFKRTKEYNEYYSFFILFLINCYFLKSNSEQFWENQNKIFNSYKFPKFFPFIFNFNNYQEISNYFFLNNYLTLLFFYDIKEPLLLIIYLDNFYKHYHNLDSTVKTQNNLNLLVYLLKTRWNHLILPSSFSLSKNIYYLKPEENLKDIINLIKKYHSSYIPSLYILRRLFPIILTFIEDILKIKINIYTFENEKSYINLINDNLKYFNKKDKISIIEDYFETLNCFLERIISSDLYYNFTKETKEYDYLSSMQKRKR